MRETDGLEKVTDFSAAVSEPGAILVRGNGRGLCHVPQTADVDGELLVIVLGQELIFAYAATKLLLLVVLQLFLRWKPILAFDAVKVLLLEVLLCFPEWEPILAFDATVPLLLGVRRQAVVR